jgi:hypothetical protein
VSPEVLRNALVRFGNTISFSPEFVASLFAPPDPSTLATDVAERVVERLGVRGALADVYTSAKSGPGIPGKSHRWMLRSMPTMRGAQKVGRDWQITRTAYEAWLRARDTSAVRRVTQTRIPDDEALADEALRMAGYRSSKRTR